MYCKINEKKNWQSIADELWVWDERNAENVTDIFPFEINWLGHLADYMLTQRLNILLAL